MSQDNPYASAQAGMNMPSKETKTSVMAIMSLVFGCLSILFSCLTGLVGIVLGIIALVTIGNSKGRLKGTGLAITGIGLSVVLSLIPILIGMLLPAVQAVRAAARRTQTMNNVRQICLSELNYESSYNRFPGEQLGSEARGSGLSWRVHILPFLNEQNLYDQFNLDEPWDSPTNAALIPLMPEIFSSIGGIGDAQLQPGETVFLRPIGNGAWPAPDDPNFQPLTIAAITDGASNTVMVIEADASEAVTWTDPNGDYRYDPSDPMRGLGNQRIGIIVTGYADGSTMAISNNAPPAEVGAAFTVSGNDNNVAPSW